MRPSMIWPAHHISSHFPDESINFKGTLYRSDPNTTKLIHFSILNRILKCCIVLSTLARHMLNLLNLSAQFSPSHHFHRFTTKL